MKAMIIEETYLVNGFEKDIYYDIYSSNKFHVLLQKRNQGERNSFIRVPNRFVQFFSIPLTDPKLFREETVDEKTVNIRYLYDVTDVAKQIFGDIILNAQQAVYSDFYWIGDNDLDEEHIQNYVSQQVSNMLYNDFIDLSLGDVVLTFVNGKTCNVFSSEYGKIVTK